jgi:ferredoxin-NADP reductase
MVTKNLCIELIARRLVADASGYYSIYFDRPANFIFDAGDWIDIQYDSKELSGGKTYSISSSPTESEIRITFREGISEFKKALRSVKSNDQFTISQYGNDYGFQLEKNQSSVLIAGGVGIAPFRSMLKEMYDNGDNNNVTLLFLNQNEDFLFKDELGVWSDHLSNLSISYINTKGINRKKREKLILSLIKSLHQNFYISGPPDMVESNEHLLIRAGVKVSDIRIDSFSGY